MSKPNVGTQKAAATRAGRRRVENPELIESLDWETPGWKTSPSR